MTEEIARDEGFSLDRKGFEEAMETQRERARESWKGSGEEALREVYKTLAAQNLKTEFVGYDQLEAEGKILKIFKGEAEVEVGKEGEEVEVITDRTPFYGESGGQMGDRGILINQGARMEVSRSTRPLPDVIVHHGTIKDRGVAGGGRAQAAGQPGEPRQHRSQSHRDPSASGRPATGSGGSCQTGRFPGRPGPFPFRLHPFLPSSEEEIDRVEEIVNSRIRENLEVAVSFHPL